MSHCLQVLARNKLLQENFKYFNPKKKKNLHAFSVLICDITEPYPCIRLAGNTSFLKIPKHLSFSKPFFTGCHPMPSSGSNTRVPELFEDLSYRLALSVCRNYLWYLLLTSYTSSLSVGSCSRLLWSVMEMM